ncbi:MAG: hypothetical protein MUC38_10190 [Cyclobacteriaceae bacterium]|nr:hypothetical protein [Cyclobacteriaceae bacterium]
MSRIINGAGRALSVLVGLGIALMGAVNVGWGNDPFFGVFLIGLALVFFPPVTTLIHAKTGFAVHPIIKVLVALFAVWAAVGVGELGDKVELMMATFR